MDHEATLQQPSPRRTEGDVWLLVMKDMEERRQFGIKKYGVPVQAGNGRDALVDAYQEVLDQVVYLRQKIEENSKLKVELQCLLSKMKRIVVDVESGSHLVNPLAEIVGLLEEILRVKFV